MDDKPNLQSVVFGGGCFWCTEAIFGELKGVTSVMPGYARSTHSAGSTSSPQASSGQAGSNSLAVSGGKGPTYEEVSTGATGYVEVVEIEFDPAQVSFEDLLTVFFATHDPTTLNRQGNDVGTQYRSVIFYTTDEEKQKAEDYIGDLSKESPQPIVTAVEALDKFYPAEEYHRNYFKNNPEAGYCQVVIAPKIEKLQKKFQALMKANS